MPSIDLTLCQLWRFPLRKAVWQDLADVESIIDLVLERTHLDHPDEALIDLGLLVQLGKQCRQVILEQVWLVVRCRVKR